ncbi:hypothetical protein ACFW6E_23370 [Streptomyces olivaceoviridis]|uniref:hypothetical protein n=1 Tax=Streptomyces olivaceoviridis TaxID=1921 RepID=UPI0036BEA276
MPARAAGRPLLVDAVNRLHAHLHPQNRRRPLAGVQGCARARRRWCRRIRARCSAAACEGCATRLLSRGPGPGSELCRVGPGGIRRPGGEDARAGRTADRTHLGMSPALRRRTR